MSKAVSISDADLVRRTLAGQHDAFGDLVSRYTSAVYAITLATLRDPDRAHDAVQETFLRAYIKLDSLGEPQRFKAWLVAIARNTCLSLLRYESRRQVLPLERAEHTEADTPDHGVQEMHGIVRSKLAELDEGPREILLLYYFAGMKQHEIAELLGITRDAAQKRIERARQALGAQLVDSIDDVLLPEKRELQSKRGQIAGAVLAVPAPWQGKAAANTVAVGGTSIFGFKTAGIVAAAIAVLVILVGSFAAFRLNWFATAPEQPSLGPVASTDGGMEPPQPTPSEPPTDVSSEYMGDVPSPFLASAKDVSGALTLRGQLVSANGTPVRNAAIEMMYLRDDGDYFNREAPVKRTLRTDDDGWFSVDGLPISDRGEQEDDYHFYASVDGEAVSLVNREYHAWRSFRLHLEAAAPLGGIVESADGVVIADALLVPIKHNGERLPSEEQMGLARRTDDQGRFRYEGLPLGEWEFVLISEGYPTTYTDPVSVGEVEVVFEVAAHEDDPVIEGRITHDTTGAPIDGAYVALVYTPTKDLHWRWTTTNKDGRYRFAALAPGEYEVWLAGPTCRAVNAMEPIQIEAGDTAEVDRRALPEIVREESNSSEEIPEGIVVAGRVVTESGRPLPGARIWISGDRINSIRPAYGGPSGEFRITDIDRSTRLELYAQKAGWAMRPMERLDVSGDGQSGVEIVMIPESIVAGRVVNRAGRPVGGAGVLARGPHPYGGTGGGQFADDEGRFFIGGLYPGTHHFAVTPPDSLRLGGSDKQGPYEIARDTLHDGIELFFDDEANLTISGVVVDSNRERIVADVRAVGPVSVSDMAGPTPGYFTIHGATPGEYEVSANIMGRTSNIVRVEAGAENVELIIPAAVTIKGRVVDGETGRPVTKYSLGFKTDPAPEANATSLRSGREIDEADGSFELDKLPAGDVRVSVVSPNHRPTSTIVEDLAVGEVRDGIRIALQLGEVFSGIVRDNAGNPISGATVLLSAPDNDGILAVESTSKSDGTFTFHNASPDHYLITAEHPDFARMEQAVDIAAGSAELVMGNGATIEGYVFVNGEPAPDVSISVFEAEIRGQSDSAGYYKLEHVPSGQQILTVFSGSAFDPVGSAGYTLLHVTVDAWEGRFLKQDCYFESGNASVRFEFVQRGTHTVSEITQHNSARQVQASRIESADEIHGLLPGPATLFVYEMNSEPQDAQTKEVELKAGEVTTVTIP